MRFHATIYFDADVAFVVSANNEWVPGMTYDCPQGWRWMDSAEALRTFSRGGTTAPVKVVKTNLP